MTHTLAVRREGGGDTYINTQSYRLNRKTETDRDKLQWYTGRKRTRKKYVNGSDHRVHILVEMKQGQCICPLSWSVHCNFTGDGNSNERGWAWTPHPYLPGKFYPHDGMYARKRPLPLLLCGSDQWETRWVGKVANYRDRGDRCPFLFLLGLHLGIIINPSPLIPAQ